jgi:3-deoxy-7-phosphoheptulonate synthase
MRIIMQPDATQAQAVNAANQARGNGRHVHVEEHNGQTVIGIVVSEGLPVEAAEFEGMPGIQEIKPFDRPYGIVSREFRPSDTVVDVDGLKIGGSNIVIMAGPCAVESREQLLETAHAVAEAGAHILRGGAYKPRTSPYSFQGLGEDGLRYMAEAREQTGLKIVTEVKTPDRVPLVSTYADILQLGARNVQNYDLLHAVGHSQKPVLFKRGMATTIKEYLMAAEYILSHGNTRIMLCERGIRTFVTATRNTFDINAIPLLKELSHLPVIADPSHGTGIRALVGPVGRAAIAAGADGLIVEVHPHPDEALSDGMQSLYPEQFAHLVREIRQIAEIIGKALVPPIS